MKKNSTLIAICLICIFYTIIACYFSPFVRGSDQYWYVGEVESLSTFHGKAVTNNIFPSSFPTSNAALPRPWVQNRPVIYLVYIIYLITHNSNISWVLFNCLCVFITAFLVIRMMKVSVMEKRFFYIFCLFLVFPLNFYLALQPLPEIFNMLLVTLVMYNLLDPYVTIRNIIAASILCGLLIWQRDNYILLVLFIPFFIINRKKKLWILSIPIFLCIFMIMYLIKPLLFPSHIIGAVSLYDIVINVSPKFNMSGFFYNSHIQHSLGESEHILANKIGFNLGTQVKYDASSSLFFYVLDLMLIPYVIMLFKTKLKHRGILLTSVFFLIHFAAIALFQNQYRYASVIVPGLFLVNFWFINAYPLTIFKFRVLNTGLLALFCVMCFVIGRKNRKEAIDENVTLKNLSIYKNTVKNNAILAEFDAGKSLYLSYAFYPNITYYYLPQDNYEQISKVCHQLNTNLCIVDKNTATYKSIKNYIISETKLPTANNLYLTTIKE